MPPRIVAARNQFDQHQGEKHRERIVGAGFDLERRADARAQPQALRVHQQKHRRGVGRGHHRADQQRLDPVEPERISGDRRGDQCGQQHANGRQHHRGRQHRADALKPGPQAAIEQDQCQRDRPDQIGGTNVVEPIPPGPYSPASMPISRNTSNSGAPKRSASRLDRIPAITRTAPRRMAMLTESSDVMRFHTASENTCICILIVATVRRQGHFCRTAADPPGLSALSRLAACRRDGIDMRDCGNPAGHSNQPCPIARRSEPRFDHGPA